MQEMIIAALRRNATDAAVAAAREWVAAASGDAQAHRWLSAALKQQGHDDAALDSLDRAIALAPEDAPLHLERAGLLLRARKLDEAQAAMARSTGLDPNLFPAYVVQAQLALGRGDLEEAGRLSRIAARIAPDHPQLAAVDGMLALRRGDGPRALALLSAANRQDPNDVSVLYSLGFAYLTGQHWAFAEQAFRRVIEQVPQVKGLYVMLARLAHQQRRPDDALAALEPLLADPATDTPALRLIAGEYALQAGKPELALEHLRPVLAVAPGDRRALQAMLVAWERTGAIDDARSTLETALVTTTDAPDLWLARLALEPVGEAEARAVVERWLAAMPDFIPALEARMRVHDFDGEAEQAESVAKRIIELEPGRLSGEGRIVDALLLRDPAAAVAHVEALLQRADIPQGKRMLQNWLGMVLDRAGRPAEAAASWLAANQEQAAQNLPLPPACSVDTVMPERAPPVDTARALLLWGLPGSGIEHVVAVLATAGAPLRDDRFGTNPPQDGFQNVKAARELADGKRDGAEFVAQWRAQLPARGIQGSNIADVLLLWDNAFLLAMRPHLPEGMLLIALRDPRDMLLDWLAFGAPAPFTLASLTDAAAWMAALLEQIAVLHEQDLYPHRLVRLDEAGTDPRAVAEAVAVALQSQLPVPRSVGQSRFPAGHWRGYADALAEPFALLAPAAQRFGYPEN